MVMCHVKSMSKFLAMIVLVLGGHFICLYKLMSSDISANRQIGLQPFQNFS